MSDRQPALYLSHGAPPLADDLTWTRQLATWSSALPRPESILMISAHWEAAPPTLSASAQRVPLLYDFWGFPRHYYEATYDAPLAPALADEVTALLGGRDVVAREESRGLDHGAYVPLVEMYPDADIPVIQLSMPTLHPAALFALGRRLAPLRDQGTMLIGSGFTTHNLGWFRRDATDAFARIRSLGGRNCCRRGRRRPARHNEPRPRRPGRPPPHGALGAALRHPRRRV